MICIPLVHQMILVNALWCFVWRKLLLKSNDNFSIVKCPFQSIFWVEGHTYRWHKENLKQKVGKRETMSDIPLYRIQAECIIVYKWLKHTRVVMGVSHVNFTVCCFTYNLLETPYQQWSCCSLYETAVNPHSWNIGQTNYIYMKYIDVYVKINSFSSENHSNCHMFAVWIFVTFVF